MGDKTTTTALEGEEKDEMVKGRCTVGDQAVRNVTGRNDDSGSYTHNTQPEGNPVIRPSKWVNSEEGKESFADKLKCNLDLQVAIYCEPSKDVTELDKLEFLDQIGNELCNIPEGEEMPQFQYTIRREHYIIVEAANERSRDWLLGAAVTLKIWENCKTSTMLAKEIPKLAKGLLWLPGKKKLENIELLRRLGKQNPGLNTVDWRIFTRHEEDHGTRLFLGIKQEDVDFLHAADYKPQWSTSRGQFTPVEELINRRKTRKRIKDGRETNSSQPPNQDGRGTNQTSRIRGNTILNEALEGKKEQQTRMQKTNKGPQSRPARWKSEKRSGISAEGEGTYSQVTTPVSNLKRKPESSSPQSSQNTPQNPEKDKTEKEIFTPTRVLARSPKRLPKKQKSEQGSDVEKQPTGGKITEFFKRTARSDSGSPIPDSLQSNERVEQVEPLATPEATPTLQLLPSLQTSLEQQEDKLKEND